MQSSLHLKFFSQHQLIIVELQHVMECIEDYGVQRSLCIEDYGVKRSFKNVSKYTCLCFQEIEHEALEIIF